MSVLSMLRAWIGAPKRRVPQVTPAQARDLQESGALIVDVREPGEWKRGHIPGALHVPLGEVEKRLSEIPKDRPVVLHCAMGARSDAAAAILAENGVEDVRNMSGGFVRWKRDGLPTEE